MSKTTRRLIIIGAAVLVGLCLAVGIVVVSVAAHQREELKAHAWKVCIDTDTHTTIANSQDLSTEDYTTALLGAAADCKKYTDDALIAKYGAR